MLHSKRYRSIARSYYFFILLTPAELEMEGQAQASSGVSLGKGAWDCDAMVAIPPEKEVQMHPVLIP